MDPVSGEMGVSIRSARGFDSPVRSGLHWVGAPCLPGVKWSTLGSHSLTHLHWGLSRTLYYLGHTQHRGHTQHQGLTHPLVTLTPKRVRVRGVCGGGAASSLLNGREICEALALLEVLTSGESPRSHYPPSSIPSAHALLLPAASPASIIPSEVSLPGRLSSEMGSSRPPVRRCGSATPISSHSQ